MARATHITIGTSDCIRLDARTDAGSSGYGVNGYGQSRYEIGDDENRKDETGQDEVRQEVQVSVTYALDPGDTDLALLADEKAGEVQRAHASAWHRIGAFASGAGCSCARCRDGNDDEPEGNGSMEGSDEPDDIPPKSGWYLPGASRSQYGTNSQNGTGSRNGINSQNGTAKPETVPAPVLQPDAEPLTGPQKILIRSRAAKAGLTAYGLETLLFQQFKVWRVERLTKSQAASLLVALERDLKEREAKERQERNEAMDGFQKSAA